MKKKWIVILLSFLGLVALLTGCGLEKENPAMQEDPAFFLAGIQMPYYCSGIVEMTGDVAITYLPIDSPDNYKITFTFNKNLSADHDMNLYVIQTARFIPIIPDDHGEKKEAIQYRIKGNTLEIGTSDWEANAYYYNPMKYSAYFLPKELAAEDGSLLGEDFGLYLSWTSPNPHTQFHLWCDEYLTREDLTITMSIPVISVADSLWEKLGYRYRKVGYVRSTYEDIYSDDQFTEIADQISFGANVEIIGEKDGYYKIRYYLPREYGDPLYHQNDELEYNLDIYESEYVIERSGYIRAEHIGLIEPFDNPACKIRVYASGALSHSGEIQLLIHNDFFPYTNMEPYSLYYKENEDAEVAIDQVPALIDNNQVNALEAFAYSYFHDIFNNSSYYPVSSAQGSLKIYDEERHFLLKDYLKDDRPYVLRLVEQYYQQCFRIWKEAIGSEDAFGYKEQFDRLYWHLYQYTKVFNDWSEVSPALDTNALLALVKQNVFPQLEEEKIDGYFEGTSFDQAFVDLFLQNTYDLVPLHEIRAKRDQAFGK